jgi:hypothetical protein
MHARGGSMNGFQQAGMLGAGLEPARPFGHSVLSAACIPVSPPEQSNQAPQCARFDQALIHGWHVKRNNAPFSASGVPLAGSLST